MAKVTDNINPSFVSFPYHTDRTAWRPFGLPMILVAPHTTDSDGNRLLDSGIDKVKIYIKQSSISPVAGHDNVGKFNPSSELYVIELDYAELTPKLIDLDAVDYLTADGQLTDSQSDATHIQFYTKTHIEDKIDYITHAYYYDLSDVKLPVENLPPNKYELIYEAYYNQRTAVTTQSGDDNAVCIDPDRLILTRHKFIVKHPGDIILHMIESTPSVYLTASERSKDTTVAFYRPFTEVLQDVYDEQSFLESVNRVFDIPSEHIPYLSYLLGWELPYYPRSIDSLRRTILRNMARLQQLKGTKRVVRELFGLFGFIAEISNIWWSPDGKYYLAPNEDSLSEYSVTSTRTRTTEQVVTDYVTPGFGKIKVPLTKRPSDDSVLLNAILVSKDSPAFTELQSVNSNLSDDLNNLDIDASSGLPIISSPLDGVKSSVGVIGYSQVSVDHLGSVTLVDDDGISLLHSSGVKFDRYSNSLFINFAQHLSFTDSSVLYIYATYPYSKITVPESMKNLQSNRFDIVLNTKSNDELDVDTLEFLVDYLTRIKAFHSLLRKFILNMSLDEAYLVTDLCVGGDFKQRPDTGLGKQQVPPGAIIPDPAGAIGKCNTVDPEDYGYRPWDIQYRQDVISSVEAEFKAWKDAGTDCSLNSKGQNRTLAGADIAQTFAADEGENIHGTTIPATLCELDGSDYCYKGRVGDPLGLTPKLDFGEIYRLKPCDLGVGHGVYYLYDNRRYITENPFSRFLNSNYLFNPLYKSYFGRLYGSYSTSSDVSIHYSDNEYLDGSIDPARFIGVRRPQLDIQKDNLNFPQHRLPGMFALTDIYASPTHNLRPWDFPIQCDLELETVDDAVDNPSDGAAARAIDKCTTTQYPNPLDARLEIGSDGDQIIVFDIEQYAIDNNGLPQDVTTLGEHTQSLTIPQLVTHKIYTSDIDPLDQSATTGHIAISFDSSVAGDGISAVDETSDTSIINFNSARECDDSVYDYIDGYPADSGDITISNYGWEFEHLEDESSGSDDLRSQLGLPDSQDTLNLTYRLSSQIRLVAESAGYELYKPHRMDCGCLDIDCDITGDTVPGNIQESDIDSCQLDVDRFEVTPTLSFIEIYNTTTRLSDNKLTTFFELNRGWSGPDSASFPPSGEFTYADSYGVIYQHIWTTDGSFIDYTLVTSEPRIWGISAGVGQIRDGEVFRSGIITTTRSTYQATSFGFALLNQTKQQVAGEFKSSNLKLDNPFADESNHSLVDVVESEITCGPRWVNPDDDGSANTVQWSPVSDTGTQPLIWVNIHDDVNIVSVCNDDIPSEIEDSPELISGPSELDAILANCYEISSFSNSLFDFTCDKAIPASTQLDGWDGKFFYSSGLLYNYPASNYASVILKTIKLHYVESGIQSYWQLYLEVYRNEQSCVVGEQSALYRRYESDPDGAFTKINGTGPNTLNLVECIIEEVDDSSGNDTVIDTSGEDDTIKPLDDVIISGFDAGTDGWVVVSGATIDHRTTGGNDDGYLFITDIDAGSDIIISAPTKFTGDLRDIDGGAISFDLRVINPPSEYTKAIGTITIDGGLHGEASLSLINVDPIEDEWIRYSADFTAASFGISQSQWHDILGNVNRITVNLELGAGLESFGFDNFTLRKQNIDGFTDLYPSPDTMFVYVSSSGGSDDNSGNQSATPVATLSRAIEIIRPTDGSRDNKPDWILFKRGDEFGDAFADINFNYSGRSSQERLVLAGYGVGDRPKFSTSDVAVHNINSFVYDSVDNIAITGLHFHAYKRDISNANFDIIHAKTDYAAIDFRIKGNNWLIEDCLFEYYSTNIKIDIHNEGIIGPNNIIIRRNSIVNAYNALSSTASHGIFMTGCDDVRIEDNYIDGNGWSRRLPVSSLSTRTIGHVTNPDWVIGGLADFNGDEKPDIVWFNHSNRSVYLWLINDSGIEEAILYDDPSDSDDYHILAVADFNPVAIPNQDAIPDLLWRNGVTGEIELWLLQVTFDTEGPVLDTARTVELEPRADVSWQVAGVGDFSGNGINDLVWRNVTSGQNEIWVYNELPGEVRYERNDTVTLPFIPINWDLIGVADLNHTGTPDLMWYNSDTGEIIAWLMDNFTRVSTVKYSTEFSLGWKPIGISDLNIDGHHDILWHNSVTGEIRAEYMDSPKSRANNHSIVIESDNTSSNVVISDNIITRSSHMAIKLESSGLVTRNFFGHNPTVGLIANDAAGHITRFEDNVISNIVDGGIVNQGGGIRFRANQEVLIDNNIFSHGLTDGSKDRYAVKFDYGAAFGQSITANTIYDFPGGLLFDGSSYVNHLVVADNELQNYGELNYNELEIEDGDLFGLWSTALDNNASEDLYAQISSEGGGTEVTGETDDAAATSDSLNSDLYVDDPDGGQQIATHRIELNFTVAVSGDYKIWVRVRTDGVDSSIWTTIDNNNDYIWDINNSANFEWQAVGARAVQVPFIRTLSTGSHKLIFKFREIGVEIDKIIITNDLEFTPEDTPLSYGNIPLQNHRLVTHILPPDFDVVSYDGNKYYYGYNNNQWVFVNLDKSFNEWIDYSDETTDAERIVIDYDNPNRSIASYIISIGGTGLLDDFSDLQLSRSVSTWDDALTAISAINHVRHGFNKLLLT